MQPRLRRIREPGARATKRERERAGSIIPSLVCTAFLSRAFYSPIAKRAREALLRRPFALLLLIVPPSRAPPFLRIPLQPLLAGRHFLFAPVVLPSPSPSPPQPPPPSYVMFDGGKKVITFFAACPRLKTAGSVVIARVIAAQGAKRRGHSGRYWTAQRRGSNRVRSPLPLVLP